MSSFLRIARLLAVLAIIQPFINANTDEDFAFDISDEFNSDLRSSSSISSTTINRRLLDNKKFTANVGKVFHLAISFKNSTKNDVKNYEAKTKDGQPLPLWLMFDKIDGIFWGLPLHADIGTYHIRVKLIEKNQNHVIEELVLNVVDTSTSSDIDVCSPNEDITILTLLIDKGVQAIKPKQRIISINNIAQFFGLPYSAFTLKPQLEKDDITDSSVVLAGPGNLLARSSKFTTLIQVPVGCDGRLWIRTTPLIHQLKLQARDGTISEVLRLPLLGWRVKTETKPILRNKRQADDDLGSGDYEYYDGNYDDEYEDEDDDEAKVQETTAKITPTTRTTITTTTKPVSIATSSSTLTSQTHPHRHHHGEIKDADDSDNRKHQNSSANINEDESLFIPPTVTSTTSSTSSSTTTTSTTTTTTTTTAKPTTTTRKIVTTTQAIDPAYEYEYEDYDSEDDEDPIESKTIVPIFTGNNKQNRVENSPSTSTSTVADTTTISSTSTNAFSTIAKLPTTIKDVTFETTTPIPTTTTTIQQTTPFIIEVTESSDEITDANIISVTEIETVVPVVTSTKIASAIPTTTDSMTFIVNSTTTTVPTTRLVTNSTTTSTITTPTITVASTTTPVVTTGIEDEYEDELDVDEDESLPKLTTIRHIPQSTQRTTTIREITEEIDYGTRNFQPYIENRIKQMSVIAGKIFRFVIPRNTFKDFEDSYNLTIEVLNYKSEPLTKHSWCHYNPLRREIYGLPLEKDVSKWEYVVKATDKDGGSVSDRFIIQVQQHKLQRVVNHEFSLIIRIEKPQEFHHYVDWCLKTLRALGRIYNSNMSEITVRNINYTNDPVVFTWTNDSIPTNYCPKEEIQQSFNMLTANDRGDASRELNLALAPELRVKNVVKHYLSICEEEEQQIPITPQTNFPPFLRNPVDHINATVGELLIFRVPDDTFYDPEDVDSRLLNISLMTGERQPIPEKNWLQFDSKNKEFYGIPRKVGRSEYQLVCMDTAGLLATDSLELVVYPAPKINYNVEFSMTIVTPYEHFINSATMQKKFVEKLKEIFNDRDTSYIHLNPFKEKDGSTIVSWYNKSLNAMKCPHDEINRFETILKSYDSKSISSRVHTIMDPEFPVSSITVLPIGNCKRKQLPAIPPPKPKPEDDRNVPDELPPPESSNYDYAITYIVPAAVVAAMLLLAGVLACVLYRRKRTGKMNVEEDGRPNYGNKGIPVIFQEELDEKPEAGTKTPIILKDEKPPLAPPEYSKSGSLKLTDDTTEPYQPPPPFTRTQDNGRQSRPKPTPTYRKPPPYVPP